MWSFLSFLCVRKLLTLQFKYFFITYLFLMILLTKRKLNSLLQLMNFEKETKKKLIDSFICAIFYPVAIVIH
ncbi:hypothetical protein C0J52_03007 [Blattella germanica]|nr:hypothetical protein C0J52_03007 [Blattella germanica]